MSERFQQHERNSLADVLQGKERCRNRLILQSLSTSAAKRTFKTAFITVVTVPSILAQAELRPVLKHFSSHMKLLRAHKFCRSITSGPNVPVVQVGHVKEVLDRSATDRDSCF